MNKRAITLQTALLLGTIILAIGLMGCDNPNGPVSTGNGGTVDLQVSFSKSSSGLPLLKSSGTDAIDSLRIDSAVVVLAKIRFCSRVDTVAADSMGHGDDREHPEYDGVTFRGPFVIHVRDTLSIDLGSQTLPAGTYDGVKVEIHKLQMGERHEDCYRHRHQTIIATDTSVAGSSIIIWGSSKKNGVWTPFTLRLDMELEFKVKGNFVVAEDTQALQIALNFNMAKWFKNPFTGALIDPTDSGLFSRQTLMRAIRYAFYEGHGGHDHNHDGHPDD
jgi:hypothetical protein